MGRVPVALQSLWSVKRALKLLISIQMSPFLIVYFYWLDAITPGKKITKELRTHMALVTRPEDLRTKSSNGMSSNKIIRINRLI